jgi:hypothetical protein
MEPGPPDDHGTGCLQPFHDGGAARGLNAIEGRTTGGHPTLVVDEVLETDGDPGQRPWVRTALDGDIELGGSCHRPLVIDLREDVERGLGPASLFKCMPDAVGGE